jgi:hypothetical protein
MVKKIGACLACSNFFGIAPNPNSKPGAFNQQCLPPAYKDTIHLSLSHKFTNSAQF